jgi:hypothetical protein
MNRRWELCAAVLTAAISLGACAAPARVRAAEPGATPTYWSAVRECHWRYADRRTHVRRSSNYDPKIAGCLRASGWTPGGVPLRP